MTPRSLKAWSFGTLFKHVAMPRNPEGEITDVLDERIVMAVDRQGDRLFVLEIKKCDERVSKQATAWKLDRKTAVFVFDEKRDADVMEEGREYEAWDTPLTFKDLDLSIFGFGDFLATLVAFEISHHDLLYPLHGELSEESFPPDQVELAKKTGGWVRRDGHPDLQPPQPKFAVRDLTTPDARTVEMGRKDLFAHQVPRDRDHAAPTSGIRQAEFESVATTRNSAKKVGAGANRMRVKPDGHIGLEGTNGETLGNDVEGLADVFQNNVGRPDIDRKCEAADRRRKEHGLKRSRSMMSTMQESEDGQTAENESRSEDGSEDGAKNSDMAAQKATGELAPKAPSCAQAEANGASTKKASEDAQRKRVTARNSCDGQRRGTANERRAAGETANDSKRARHSGESSMSSR